MEPNYPPQATDLFTDAPIVYAGFWERFGAAFIDGIIIVIVGFVLGLIFPKPTGDLFGTADAFNIVLGWLYYALQESGSNQATLGKKALGLKVTSVAGNRISFGQATGRHFGKWVSTIILLIGYLMMLWNDRRQTLHDMMADTLVIKAQ